MSTTILKDLIELLYDRKIDLLDADQLRDLKLPQDYNNKIKNKISEYKYRVPLYDVKSNNVYLIHNDNVYLRIYYNNYRFITKHLINSNVLDREIVKFLSFYDLKKLKNTYYKIFYNSFTLNNYITTCNRPSFSARLAHIPPYYTSNELYFLGYDWEFIDKAKLTTRELRDLCNRVSQFDISGETLLSHQMYIYNTTKIGLVKHYSLYGSYYINWYLRKSECSLKECNNENLTRNIDLENQINLTIDLVSKAPPFTVNHTVYRFIKNDNYINDLKIGDVYTDPGFVSTTRDPFHYQQNYQFGFILIKIKIPSNINGVGLCIESYSNFPHEQEIILPPTSEFRLDKKINEPSSYHHILNKKVSIKYEMTLLGNAYTQKQKTTQIPLEMNQYLNFNLSSFIPVINNINFVELMQNDSIKSSDTVAEKLKIFNEKFVKNSNNQFSCAIGDIHYLFAIESYDSTSVYKEFFYYEVSDGIMITCSNKLYGNINIIIEIGVQLHVNYYFRHSVTEKLFDLNNKNWIEWLSLLAYIFGAKEIILHSTHFLHKNERDNVEDKQIKSRYTYSEDIYQYLKNKNKMYNENYITANFDYTQLDYLYTYDAALILNKTERDELYNIYQSSKTKTIRDFYLYVVETCPQFIHSLESKIGIIYEELVNPFNNISYKLDADTYLYNMGIIIQIRSINYKAKKGTFKKLIADNKIAQFKNRLRAYLNN